MSQMALIAINGRLFYYYYFLTLEISYFKSWTIYISLLTI